VSLITGLHVLITGLDRNPKISFYALWYAIDINNFLDFFELLCSRDAFQL